MLNHEERLDLAFRALGDRTRRGLVERLVHGPASVSELAAPLTMSLAAVVQHIQVLETAGIVRSEKVGRVRICRIEPEALRAGESWLGRQRTAWETNLDNLGGFLVESGPSEGNTMTVTHTTFSLARTYAAEPARVFAAWSDPAAKARWFGSGDTHELDFRAGGRELTRGRTPDGKSLEFASVYHDIVPDQRIVYSSTLTADDSLATVSTTTVELTADGKGTRLTLTEQGTFLDGREEASWREKGTSDWLAKLGKEFQA